MIKHSVIMITYNQENLIGRAIESILCQKDFVFEIIISDDCSTDSTWTVINSYKVKYPELIKPIRNEKNLGIFAHIEATWKYPTGDIIYFLSGDDELCNGLFEKANHLVKTHNIDYINEAFTLYFDFKTIAPDGKESIYSNRLITEYCPISLKIRNIISNRTTGFSRKVLEKFYPINKSIGIYADGLIDIQTQLFSNKNYYFPFIGSVYYTSIGISSKTKRREHIESYIKCLDNFFIVINDLSKSDKTWINYLKSKLSFELKPSVFKLFKYFALLIQITEFKFGFDFIKAEYKQFLKLLLWNAKYILFKSKEI